MKCLRVCVGFWWKREEESPGDVGMAQPERWRRGWGELGVRGGMGGGNWLNNFIIACLYCTSAWPDSVNSSLISLIGSCLQRNDPHL